MADEQETGVLSAASLDALVSRAAPRLLAETLRRLPPIAVTSGGDILSLPFERTEMGHYEARAGNLHVTLHCDYLPDYRALRWTTTLSNTGDTPLTNLGVLPLLLRLDADPALYSPRVRHLGGSYHYDGVYPPRAFRESEEVFITHDHCKPARIESGAYGSAFQDVPLLQFAVGRQGILAGFTVGFEWSGRWFLEAAWERNSFEGEARPDLLVRGNVGMETFRLEPGESVTLPRIHLVFAQTQDWDGLSNAFRRYVTESLAPSLQGDPPLPPVSYDHWFGIHQNFDVKDMMRQAERAAEIGCEYFCLDAAWYQCKHWTDGPGNWFTPDPMKFPNGVEELSAHVRSLGMTFGLWHMLENAVEGTEFRTRRPDLFLYEGKPSGLRLDLPEGRAFVLERLRYWCENWKVRWMRWESLAPDWTYQHDPTGKLALAYVRGYYEIIDTLRSEVPDLYIEGCQGGGMRFDLGMVARTHGTWLSDHTAHPDVCRFCQTGALRFWPPQYLNSAVRVHRNTGDKESFAHNFLSRMVGTMSFNGDIAQWSEAAAKLAKQHVQVYKQIRFLLAQPVFFPLPQPRSPRDWDAVLYGDGSGAGQLLYAFRMEGPERLSIPMPQGQGEWKRLLGSETAQIEAGNGGVRLSLESNSSALWMR